MKVTIRAELAPEVEADEVEITVTQGPVQLRQATAEAHDAAASFEMDDGDYVAHVRAEGHEPVSAVFAVPRDALVTLTIE